MLCTRSQDFWYSREAEARSPLACNAWASVKLFRKSIFRAVLRAASSLAARWAAAVAFCEKARGEVPKRAIRIRLVDTTLIMGLIFSNWRRSKSFLLRFVLENRLFFIGFGGQYNFVLRDRNDIVRFPAD